MADRSLEEIFDRVMRIPESQRGMDVVATARLLAEEIKRLFADSYKTKMDAMEAHYLDQFLHTISANSGFADRVRGGMALYK